MHGLMNVKFIDLAYSTCLVQGGMLCFLYSPRKRRSVLSAVLVSQKARCSGRQLFLWLLSSCVTEITALVMIIHKCAYDFLSDDMFVLLRPKSECVDRL